MHQFSISSLGLYIKMRVLGVVAFSFVLAFSCIEGKWVSDWIRMTIDSPAVVADKVNIVFT